MKSNYLSLVAFALINGVISAHAAERAEPVRCYDLAVPVKVSFGATADRTNLPTGAKLCVSGKATGPEDESTLRTPGNFRLTVQDAKGKQVALYRASVRSAEGAAGTIYETYGASNDDLDKYERDEYSETVQLALRNDRVRRGEYAGRFKADGSELTLLGR